MHLPISSIWLHIFHTFFCCQQFKLSQNSGTSQTLFISSILEMAWKVVQTFVYKNINLTKSVPRCHFPFCNVCNTVQFVLNGRKSCSIICIAKSLLLTKNTSTPPPAPMSPQPTHIRRSKIQSLSLVYMIQDMSDEHVRLQHQWLSSKFHSLFPIVC